MPTPPPPSSGQGASAAAGRSASRPSPAQVLPLVPGLPRRPARQRPLPDAAAVRLLAVPDSAPPYDDELPAAAHPAAGPARASEPGPDRPPEPAPERTARPAKPPASRTGSLRPPDRDRTSAVGWPSQFAQVLAETLAGSRPPGQITPWTSEQARKRIRQLGPLLAAEVRPRVRRVVACQPAAGIVEMTVIVGVGHKVSALAVRLERDQQPAASGPGPGTSRWVCTAVEAA